MHRHLRLTFIVAVFALAIASATTVFAAPADWESVDVSLHTEQNGSILLVSGHLPANAKLPAEAELSVPAGAELQWIGEILGGPAAEDPAVEYTKRTADGNDIYTFTLTQAREAQIEVAGAAAAFDGTTYNAAVAWTAAQDVPTARVSIRVPDTARLTETPKDVAGQPGQDGYSIYTKVVDDVKAGDKLDLALSYTISSAAVTAASTPTGSSDGSLIAIIVVALVIVVAAAVVIARRSGSTGTVQAPAPEGADAAAASDDDDAPVVRANPAAVKKRKIATAAIIGGLILVAVVVGTQSTKPKMVGDTATQTFAPGEACSTANIALKSAGDPGKTADVVFEALRTAGGINNATYNAKSSSVQVGFCDSVTTEQAVRTAIEKTGLLAE